MSTHLFVAPIAPLFYNPPSLFFSIPFALSFLLSLLPFSTLYALFSLFPLLSSNPAAPSYLLITYSILQAGWLISSSISTYLGSL